MLLRDRIRMAHELVVEIGGNIPHESYGNSDDGKRLEGRERPEETHWAMVRVSNVPDRNTTNLPRGLHDFVAHQEKLCNDTKHVEVHPKGEKEIPKLQHLVQRRRTRA